MTTHVLIGADSCRDYQFLAPLSALVWRDVIGFHPVVMKVGDWAEKKRGIVALEAMQRHGIDYVHVEPMAKYEPGRTAQQCRELAGCLPIPDEEWAMPTDADLWPIRKEFYQQHYARPGRITAYYSNGDHGSTLPTCHVTMQLRKWRQLYGVKPGDDVTAACLRNFEEWLPKRRFWKEDLNFALWMADQAIVTDKVFADPDGYIGIERRGHPPVDRLDRGAWPTGDYDLAAYVDSHLLRPADQPEYWPRIRVLIEKLIPQHLDWACRYREEYILGY
jgi:hypothetical protein